MNTLTLDRMAEIIREVLRERAGADKGNLSGHTASRPTTATKRPEEPGQPKRSACHTVARHPS